MKFLYVCGAILTILVIGLLFAPIIHHLYKYKYTRGNDRERRRFEVESIIDNELMWFRARHGLQRSIGIEDLFRRYEIPSSSRFGTCALSDVDSSELLTLYAVGIVRREAGEINITPLFGDPGIDKSIPHVLLDLCIDRDSDGWFEVRIPGTHSSVYEVEWDTVKRVSL